MSSINTSYNLTTEDKKNIPISSVCKYLDIDSTHRNRNNYPNQNNFVIPISYSNRGSNNPIDPISDSLPYTDSTNAIGTNVTQAGSTTTSIILDAAETVIDNYYINSYLEIGNETRKIVFYNGSTKIAVVESGFSIAPGLGVIYYIRKNLPSLTSTVSAIPAPTLTTFTITSSLSINPNGPNYVRFTSGLNINLVFLITSYDLSTNSITVDSMPNIPVTGDTLEIDSFTKDNAFPLIYSGLDTTPTNSYYEIELQWLSVPNVVLGNGYGGKLDRYPFIYLHLYNEGKRLYNQPMYSNNPNSTLALFKIPVNEYFGDTSFITLKDAKTKQVVRFEPNKDLRFTLTLPDGNIIEYYENDKLSPNEPDPLLQVNALFSLRKLS